MGGRRRTSEGQAKRQRLLGVHEELMESGHRAEGGGQSWGGDGSTLMGLGAPQSLDVKERKSWQGDRERKTVRRTRVTPETKCAKQNHERGRVLEEVAGDGPGQQVSSLSIVEGGHADADMSALWSGKSGKALQVGACPRGSQAGEVQK